MSLSLPADIEPYLDGQAFERIRGPAVYCLSLVRPEDVQSAWLDEFDNKAPYLDELAEADTAYYIGAANDLLHRLNDHNDRDVRKAALLRVCAINALENVWWFDSTDKAFQQESRIAIELANELPNCYVHQR